VSARGNKCHSHNTENQPYLKVKLSPDGPQLSRKALDLLAGRDVAARTLRVKCNTAYKTISTDRPGWVYVYYLRGDESSTYFKVGCTSLSKAEARVKQWPGATMRYAVHVPFNELAEKLVHTLLDEQRLLRYVFKDDDPKGGVASSGKHYLTVGYNSKTIVRDRAYKRVVAATETPAPFSTHVWEQLRAGKAKPGFGTRTKEVEWFKSPFSRIKLAMDEVAVALEHWHSK
jgi:hypothetical protein